MLRCRPFRPVLCIKSLDAFSKPEDPEVMQVKTTSGAIVSVVSVVVMLWLAVSELQLYRSTEIVNNLLVDAAQTEQVQAATSEVLAFSIALYSQRCDTLRYYLRDSKGNMLDIGSNAVRTSSWVPPELLAADPNYKPTREEAPGCRLDATIPIPKVAAEFKLLPKDFEPQQQQMQQFVNIPQFNSSHKIISLRFGPPIPDQAFPLDDVIKTAEKPTSFDYYLQLVPSEYVQLSGVKRTTNQYSVTEFDQVAGVYSGQIVPPAITLKYDFSPIMVQIKEQHRSFLQFITSLCAIVGGVFVVSGFINSSLFKTIQLLGKPKASTNVE